MDEKDFLEVLREALLLDIDELSAIKSVRTFKECGMLVVNPGLVVKMKDGYEFQLVVIRS